MIRPVLCVAPRLTDLDGTMRSSCVCKPGTCSWPHDGLQEPATDAPLGTCEAAGVRATAIGGIGTRVMFLPLHTYGLCALPQSDTWNIEKHITMSQDPSRPIAIELHPGCFGSPGGLAEPRFILWRSLVLVHYGDQRWSRPRRFFPSLSSSRLDLHSDILICPSS
jgi:hypothetical protein